MSVIAAKALTIAALAIAPGESVAVRGAVSTRHDGAVLEPAALVDAAAGGLREVSRAPGEVRLEAIPGAVGPACAASGVSSPCLVPRLAEHAHARLLGVDELRASLEGALEIAFVPAKTPPPPAPSKAPSLVGALVGAVAGVLVVALAWARRARRSPLFDVIAAASIARRATKGDPLLVELGLEIDRLVDEARALDRQRAAAEAVLARQTRARGPRTPEEIATLDELRGRLARARARLAEIASALRIVPSRLVTLDGRAGAGAVSRVIAELTLRERAVGEADALSSRDAAC